MLLRLLAALSLVAALQLAGDRGPLIDPDGAACADYRAGIDPNGGIANIDKGMGVDPNG